MDAIKSSITAEPESSLLTVHILELSGESGLAWIPRTTSIEEVLKDTANCVPNFVFAGSEKLKSEDQNSYDLQRKLEDRYGMPTGILASTYWKSNGFFGCSGSEMSCHRTWFLFLVKTYSRDDTGKDSQAHWYRMGFFSSWSPTGRRSILCLDCPKEFRTEICKSLDSSNKQSFSADPYCFHPHILGAMVHTYDNTIWRIHDFEDALEKNRAKSGERADFKFIHGISRHVIHNRENSTVATEIISKMVKRHGSFVSRINSFQEAAREHVREIQDSLEFHHGTLFGFKCRCEALQQRHEDEIALAQSTTLSTDSAASLKIAATMKIVAIASAVFLPATFISVSLYPYLPLRY
ncbi:hypothetical protein TWF730_001388 [Orbilia blumenaviensis]|uniref:Uncharacterized protein n=1 Tax=Orbilia blumenaviensis TaxID=1796055 RepID=A0AAV9UKX4_9PEZI